MGSLCNSKSNQQVLQFEWTCRLISIIPNPFKSDGVIFYLSFRGVHDIIEFDTYIQVGCIYLHKVGSLCNSKSNPQVLQFEWTCILISIIPNPFKADGVNILSYFSWGPWYNWIWHIHTSRMHDTYFEKLETVQS